MSKPNPEIKDLVRTKTGRQGIVRQSNHTTQTAIVKWEDGEEFAIRFVHLEVLAHNCEMSLHSKYRPGSR